MTRRRMFAILPLAALATLLPATTQAPPAQAVTVPTLVAVRAAHHPGYDRVVFEFTGSLPTAGAVWTTNLYADGSGARVNVPGRSILTVFLRGAQAHTDAGRVTVPTRVAYALPGVLTTVKAGDFEGQVTYGIGVAKRTSYTITRLTSPSRVVVDITTPYTTVNRAVYFTDAAKVAAGVAHPVTAVSRPVIPTAPGTAVLDRLYAGPTPAEKARGLSLTASRSTGFTGLTVSSDAIARVRLTGGCGGGSAVVNVADQITPTLKQFATVRWVKIYDPAGTTLYPTGRRDSTPECLEP